ncbi:NlpC/P60 family protein [Yoonia sediminilitoris]|uniref:NlpC/P60 family putative phage cell wall peptidase n=1 Tax=Yoonia sediminilitoris TaxID=1286148 RepID=A0A2T6KDK1_9RHOB|nr:NlpC/P60 family protein [Yoonia sediminilitoris]PUB13122.1 NlpC/P60 family putative phage cell wall peptidase [Yoonia sediminilitoris]RCW94457.1 NlpC/P60 family putative phage cell wall peptidase [Yoonia sediminilitoris]
MTHPFAIAARDWIGTPYLHQGATKCVGCDCLGLIRGIWQEVNGAEPEQVPAYTADWAEPQGREVLLAAATRHMHRTEALMAPGQILLFRMRDGAVAKHLGILTATDPYPKFVHAYTGHGVVESPLSAPWRRRIAARFEVLQG